MKKFATKRLSRRAQAAVEMAVFGGILVFVLGLIIRQATNSNMGHNYALKAMRLAMSMSFKTSLGMDSQQLGGGGACSARNSASVLFIEDRLAPTGNKYGPVTRVPFIVSGTGSFTNTLFIPFDKAYHDNIPRFDVIMNGKHFIFTLGGFVEYIDFSSDPSKYPEIPWLEDCLVMEAHHECAWSSSPTGGTWVLGPSVPEDRKPCRLFYKVLENITETNKSEQKIETDPEKIRMRGVFCWYDGTPAQPGSCTQYPDDGPGPMTGPMNLTADERFDLDRDPATSGDRIPEIDRKKFKWQWFQVIAADLKYSKKKACVANPAFPGTARPHSIRYKPTTIYAQVVSAEDTSENLEVDVDGDRKAERILRIYPPNQGGYDSAGRLDRFLVYDSQGGDMDLTHDARNKDVAPGLQPSVQMFSKTNPGTYLLLEEGKLEDPLTGQEIRSVQKRDRVDLIQRTVQLSRDTGNICGNGTPADVTNYPQPLPPTAIATWDVEKSKPNDKRNPEVETCACRYGKQNYYYHWQNTANPNCGATAHNSCFDANTITTTCFDEDSHMLYVRSRVHDLTGSKWRTRIYKFEF